MTQPPSAPRVRGEVHEAYELVGGRADAAVFITCEHASDRFVAPWALRGEDERLVETHWASDPGAEALVRGLASLLDAPAVLGRYSRLIIDPNRPLDAPTLFRSLADGLPILLNSHIGPEDRTDRIARLWEPYHLAADRALFLC